MSMAGPYGIEQFDAGNALAMYRQGRADRIQDLKQQRDREFNRVAAEMAARTARPVQRLLSAPSAGSAVIARYGRPDQSGESSAGLTIGDPTANMPADHRPDMPGMAPRGMANAFARPQVAGTPPIRSDADSGAVEQATSQMPSNLVDPAGLPPRTDGVSLNHSAMRRLYELDPERAMAFQSSIFNMDKQQIAATVRRGEGMARAAVTLMDVKGNTPEETDSLRRQALRQMEPHLREYGFGDDALGNGALDGIDVSDQGLKQYLAFGQNLDALIDDRRSDRRLQADLENMDADNARADRNTDNLIDTRNERLALTRRGQDIASSDRRYSTDRASADRRYGVNTTDARVRRGQDMLDQRVRAGFGARGGRAGAAAAPAPSVGPKAGQIARNPATGQTLRFDGKAWVAVK